MDFSKLTSNEKLAVYGSVALIVGAVVGYGYGLANLGILAAIAMLIIIFLPQLSPNTNLPGSRGSLMVAAGGLAGAAMVLALLSALTGALLINTNLRDVFFLVAAVGGVVMAWAGWQELQSEGGKLRFGTASGATRASKDAGHAEAGDAPPLATDPAPATDPATAPAPGDTTDRASGGRPTG